MDVPDFDDALVDLIAGQSDAQSGHIPIRQLERIRDDNLVAIQKALQATNWGAGELLAQHEAALAKAAPEPDWTQPLPTFQVRVPAHWLDYNGHMTESRYLEAFAFGTDGFMRMVGIDADAIAAGHPSSRPRPTSATWRSVPRRGHPHRDAGDLGAGRKVTCSTGCSTATAASRHREHLRSTWTSMPAPPPSPRPRSAQGSNRVARAHAGLPTPDGLGRHVGQPKG
jgi:carnitine 3-dehydrogenase